MRKIRYIRISQNHFDYPAIHRAAAMGRGRDASSSGGVGAAVAEKSNHDSGNAQRDQTTSPTVQRTNDGAKKTIRAVENIRKLLITSTFLLLQNKYNQRFCKFWLACSKLQRYILQF